MKSPLTDTCPMPYGKYAGKEMQDVPAKHLLYLWDLKKAAYRAGTIDKNTDQFRVLEYIEDNEHVLKKELTEKKQYGST